MKQFKEQNITDFTRADWLELRQKGIGGSDAGAILGLNKWKTPFEVYMDKVEPIEDNGAGEAAYWGNQLEDMVAREFTVRTGKKVRRNNRMMTSIAYPFMLANIDREIVGEDAILECKTANAYAVKDWEDGKVPPSYIIQGQHYLAVTGKQKIYYAVLIGGQKFYWCEFERDEELIQILIEREFNFWNEHVLKKVPPALDGSSAAEKYLKERFEQAEEGTAITLPPSYSSQITTMLELKAKAKEIEEQAAEIENGIKLELGTAESGFTNEYIVTWKNVTSNRLDTKALKKDLPEISEKYSKESQSRRFTVKSFKGEE